MGEGDIQPDKPGEQAASNARPGLFSPFSYPIYRNVWIANLLSHMGAIIQTVGAAWLMTDLSHSHRMVALVQASTTIPLAVFGIFSGAFADSYDRRKIMLYAQIGMFVFSCLLCLLTWQGLITPWLLLFLTLAIGMGTAINSPAWQTSVRMMVPRTILPQAISLNSIAFNVGRSVGPGLGGLLISIFSVSAAFVFNAVSYLGMITVLWRWKPEAPARRRQPMLPAIAEGLRLCATEQTMRRILARGLAFGIGTAGYQGLIPSVVRDQLHGSELQYGLLLCSFGIGSITAAFFMPAARRRWGSELVVTLATLTLASAQIVLAHSRNVIEAVPATMLAGAGWVSVMTTLSIAIQFRVPDRFLGRCLSINQMATFGGWSFGAWLWGAVADQWSLPGALNGAALFLIASLIVLRVVAPLPKRGEGRIGDPS